MLHRTFQPKTFPHETNSEKTFIYRKFLSTAFLCIKLHNSRRCYSVFYVHLMGDACSAFNKLLDSRKFSPFELALTAISIVNQTEIKLKQIGVNSIWMILWVLVIIFTVNYETSFHKVL